MNVLCLYFYLICRSNCSINLPLLPFTSFSIFCIGDQKVFAIRRFIYGIEMAEELIHIPFRKFPCRFTPTSSWFFMYRNHLLRHIHYCHTAAGCSVAGQLTVCFFSSTVHCLTSISVLLCLRSRVRPPLLS